MHISRTVLTVALAATTASAIPTCNDGSCTHNGGNGGVAPALVDGKPEQQSQPAAQQPQRFVKPGAESEDAQPMKVSRSHQSRASGNDNINGNNINGQGFKEQSYTAGQQGGVLVPDIKATVQPAEEQQALGFAGKKDGYNPANSLGWGDGGRRFKSGDDTKAKNGRRAVVTENMMDSSSATNDRGEFYRPQLAAEAHRDLGEEVELQPLSDKKETAVPTFGQRFKEFVSSFGGQADDAKPHVDGGIIMRRFENPQLQQQQQQQQGASRIYGGESGEQPQMKFKPGQLQRRDQIASLNPDGLTPQEIGLIRTYIREQSQTGFERGQHLYQGEQEEPKQAEAAPMRVTVTGNNAGEREGQFPWSSQQRRALLPWDLKIEQKSEPESQQQQLEGLIRRGMAVSPSPSPMDSESSTPASAVRANGAGEVEEGGEKEVPYSIIRDSDSDSDSASASFDHLEQGRRGYAAGGIINLSGATPENTPIIIVTTHADAAARAGDEQHPFHQKQGPSQDIRTSRYEQLPAPASGATYETMISQGQLLQEQPLQQAKIVQRNGGTSVESEEEGGEEGEEDAKFVVPRLDGSSWTQKQQQGWYDVLRGCFELAQAHGGEEQMLRDCLDKSGKSVASSH